MVQLIENTAQLPLRTFNGLQRLKTKVITSLVHTATYV